MFVCRYVYMLCMFVCIDIYIYYIYMNLIMPSRGEVGGWGREAFSRI